MRRRLPYHPARRRATLLDRGVPMFDAERLAWAGRTGVFADIARREYPLSGGTQALVDADTAGDAELEPGTRGQTPVRCHSGADHHRIGRQLTTPRRLHAGDPVANPFEANDLVLGIDLDPLAVHQLLDEGAGAPAGRPLQRDRLLHHDRTAPP